MHNKVTFALAGVFLAVAIVVPIVVFTVQANNDLDTIIVQNPSGMQTNGNVTNPESPQQVEETHRTNLLIVIAVEVVFIPLFLVSIYYGVRHIHPTHKPPTKNSP